MAAKTYTVRRLGQHHINRLPASDVKLVQELIVRLVNEREGYRIWGKIGTIEVRAINRYVRCLQRIAPTPSGKAEVRL